jgi:hypothetical protein
MTHTRNTDPSGYDDATVSTAADQVRLVDLLGQPATTGSRRVSWAPPPWSTALQVIGLCRIHRN